MYNNHHMDNRLYAGATEGTLSIVREFRANEVTPRSNTVLHVAADAGQTECVKAILSSHPGLILQANSRGETALHFAARAGNASTVEALLECAARQASDESMIVVSEEMVRMMNVDNETALHMAVRYHRPRASRILLTAFPNFEYMANINGETLLYMAAARGYDDLVALILDTCRSPAYGGPDGKTALHAAVLSGRKECVRKILERNTSLTNKEDIHGWTPLHLAARIGDASTVEKLLLAGRSVAYLADKDDKNTALHLAAGQGHLSAAKILIKHCPDCCELLNDKHQNFLHHAGCHGQKDLIKAMAKFEKFRFLFSEKDLEGNTPLHLLSASESYPGDISKMKPFWDIISFDKEKVIPPKGRHYDQKEEKEAKDFSEEANYHLIVSALVATVSFAAGFSVPGGISGGGKNKSPQGRPLFEKRMAFKVFMVADTVALLLSTVAILLYLVGDDYVRTKKVKRFEASGAVLTFYSIVAMMVAFIFGTYTMLEHTGLSIAVCVIASSSFIIYYVITTKYIWDSFRGNK